MGNLRIKTVKNKSKIKAKKLNIKKLKIIFQHKVKRVRFANLTLFKIRTKEIMHFSFSYTYIQVVQS